MGHLSFSASSWAVVKRCSSKRRLLFSASSRLASSALSSTTSAPLAGLPALVTYECKMRMCTNWHWLACHAHHTAADLCLCNKACACCWIACLPLLVANCNMSTCNTACACCRLACLSHPTNMTCAHALNHVPFADLFASLVTYLCNCSHEQDNAQTGPSFVLKTQVDTCCTQRACHSVLPGMG